MAVTATFAQQAFAAALDIDFPLLSYHFQNTAIAKPAEIPLLYAGAMGVTGLTALILAFLFMALSAGASNAATMLYPNLKTLPPRDLP